MKTAIITGVTGQDGAYLSKLLIEKGYKVIGLTRNNSRSNFQGLIYLGLIDEIKIEECDLTDFSQVIRIVKAYQPDEIYNLAAQSSVGLSFQQPIGTIKFNIISVLNLLEAIKIINPKIKFYQASSSEMFGTIPVLPITEHLSFNPQSPYAVSKASAHWICSNYREAYNLFISCGILFNHESFLRKSNFFVKKVLRESIRIKKGEQDVLKVGNIEIKRDFGYAPKYIEAMWLMTQTEIPSDYIVCSGVSISLRSIIEYVFDKLDIAKNKLIVDDKLFRPTEIPDIYGDCSKAKKELNWDYDYSFYEVLDILLEKELKSNK
jgi:GDPmannose 4,6-dehydratase